MGKPKTKTSFTQGNVDPLSCKRGQSGSATELLYGTYVIVWAVTPPAVPYVYSNTSLVIEFYQWVERLNALQS